MAFLQILSYLGAVWLSHQLYRFARFIHLYTRSSSISRYLHGPGAPWALITGSTDGIGLEYAQQLASHGFNIVLHGRNASKLSHYKTVLQKNHPSRSFRAVIADASLSGATSQQQIQGIVKTVENLHLTVLINNIGTGGLPDTSSYVTLEDVPPENVDALMNLNARFPAQVTRALLPTLLNNTPALILNMGSMASFGSPWVTIYSGSKGFNMAFSRSLKAEMIAEGRDIEVLGINTGKVADAGGHTEKPSLLSPDAKTFAREALRKVGCGWNVVPATWPQGMAEWATQNIMPEWMSRRVVENAIKVLRFNEVVEEAGKAWKKIGEALEEEGVKEE